MTRSEGSTRLSRCWARASGRDDMNIMNTFWADCAKALEIETDRETEKGMEGRREEPPGPTHPDRTGAALGHLAAVSIRWGGGHLVGRPEGCLTIWVHRAQPQAAQGPPVTLGQLHPRESSMQGS